MNGSQHSIAVPLHGYEDRLLPRRLSDVSLEEAFLWSYLRFTSPSNLKVGSLPSPFVMSVHILAAESQKAIHTDVQSTFTFLKGGITTRQRTELITIG